MPELPEVRAHAERLSDALSGVALDKVTILTFHALKTATPPHDAALGRTLSSVRQRGKYILVEFGDLSYVVHLMQGGRLRFDEKQSLRVKGGLARWRFADKRALLFTEAGTDHKAGVWVMQGDPETQAPIDRLGPDADQVSESALAERLRDTDSMRIHGWLRDQHHVAGLGRRLANETCWHACLSPFANSRKLSEADVARLRRAILAAIDEGLAFERARDDMSSSKERPGAVHHRAKEPCPRCATAIRTVEYSSYTIYYCPTCQTDGKVLADNTTSRFLK